MNYGHILICVSCVVDLFTLAVSDAALSSDAPTRKPGNHQFGNHPTPLSDFRINKVSWKALVQRTLWGA